MNKNYIVLIEDELNKYLQKDKNNKELTAAMEYSLMSGGKRVRPILTLEFCKACGGDIKKALLFACAVEMIHTYSLIHDDLPCMDNDNLRRGKPTNHLVNGQALALLAGDALLNLAFEILLSKETEELVGTNNTVKAARILANCSGRSGMIGGQIKDLKSEGENISFDVLEEIHSKKTGELISASAQMGCIAAGASDSQIIAAKNYASLIGLAFQVKDDILEAISTTGKIGKNINSDAINKKSTYVSVLGLEKSILKVEKLTKDAISSLSVFEDQADELKKFALELAKRDR